jgi:hypothetical protein
MLIRDPVYALTQRRGFVGVGHVLPVRNAQLRVVRWQDVRFADLFGPPAQGGNPVFDGARG